MAAGIWVKLIRHGRTARDEMIPCARQDWEDALTETCRRLDLQRPCVLPRHGRDFEQFGLVRFTPEHFIESVGFDRMEIEYIDPDSRKTRPVNEKYL